MDDYPHSSLLPDLRLHEAFMKILRKAGPLQTVGGGTMWHAVEEGVAVDGGPALCRDRSGVAWSRYPGRLAGEALRFGCGSLSVGRLHRGRDQSRGELIGGQERRRAYGPPLCSSNSE
jgi:hypothetical protein